MDRDTTTPAGGPMPLSDELRKRAGEALATNASRLRLSLRERRAALRELRRARRDAQEAIRASKRESAKASAEATRRYKSVAQQLRDRDKALSDRTRRQRAARARARDVYGAIGFDRMFRDGICEVEEGLYSETMRFTDVSYQSAREDSQTGTWKSMCSLLDWFGASNLVQYTITNTPLPPEEIGRRRFFNPDSCGDNAGLAIQYNRILNDKLREGCSNLRRGLYVTYSVEAPDPDHAVRELAAARSHVRQELASVRSMPSVLDGRARLELISSLTRPGKPFDFDYDRDLSIHSPLTAKDWVCPQTLDFHPAGPDATCFRSDDMWCQVLVMRESFSSELTDRCISDLLDLAIPMAVSWNLQPIDSTKAVQMVKQQAAWVQKETIDQQQRALRSGYDYTIIPPELKEMTSENDKLLHYLLHGQQHLYLMSGVVYTYALTRDQLNEQVVNIIGTAQAAGIPLSTFDLRQREGLNTVLPLGHNHVNVYRDLITAEAAIMMPFTTQELDQQGGGYYGQNRISNNLVVCNRKALMSPHGFICGMSGSGKSFAVKREIENTILSEPRSEININDVTGEYEYLTAANHGQELRLGPDARIFINPFDMSDAEGLSWPAALAGKVDAISAMTSAIMAEGGEALSMKQRTVISRSVDAAYRQAHERSGPDAAPTLEDFCRMLEETPGDMGRSEALELRVVYDRFVSGPMSFLNHQSNIDYTNRIISWDTRDVPADMRVFVMLATLEAQRNRMFYNYSRGVPTYIYIDEVQSLFEHPAIITYLARLWRESRKFGGIMTGMTQDATAIANHKEASAILNQSGFFLLLRQPDADRAFWAESRGLSDREVEAIDDTCRPGQGLLIADAARVPITDDFPTGNDLYDMFDTSPEEYARRLAGLRQAGRAR